MKGDSRVSILPTLIIAMVCIGVIITATGCLHLPGVAEEKIDWNLTLVGDEEMVLTFDDIKTMPSYTGRGGFFSTVGMKYGPFKCKGVPIEYLCDLVGGIDESSTIWISAPDGYMMVFDYDQIKCDFNTFDPEDLKEVPHGDLKLILTYEQDGELLPENDGRPFRVSIVGKEDLLTEGSYWVKWVNRIEIK